MPMGKSYLSVDATLDPTYVTAKLERDKIHKHASKAKELGMQFMPIAFTTYGGMGDEFLKKRWRPFFKELMAEELKAGGKGWKTRKRQQRALEKLSIVLARENGAMIARATSWQQAQQSASACSCCAQLHTNGSRAEAFARQKSDHFFGRTTQ